MQHILLIEDNKEVRENTAEILELAGYKVNTAPDEVVEFRCGHINSARRTTRDG